MRAALQYTMTNPGAGADVQVVQVLATFLRDYWLRLSGDGTDYSVGAYQSQDDAENDQGRLAYATAVAGAQMLDMIKDPGASFDPTPMQVQVTLGGSFDLCVVAWTSSVQAALLSRIEAMLAQYAGTHETLDGWNYAGIGLGLPANLPCYGIRPANNTVIRESPNRFIARVGVDLYAAAEGATDPSVIHDCVDICERLRSVALDEQLTWGGFARTTESRGPIEPARTEPDGLVVYVATLPLVIEVPELYADRPPGAPPGSGGKYAAAL